MLATAAILFAATALAWSYFFEPKMLVLVEKELVIKGLDPGLNGLKIVAIGDIHGGTNRVDEEMLDRIVAMANEQRPDIVVLLGDYIGHGSKLSPNNDPSGLMPIDTIAEKLGQIRSRRGTFAVLGNHDYWEDPNVVVRSLENVGIRVLQNEIAEINHNNGRLRLFGLVDHLQLNKSWKETSADLKAIADVSGPGDMIVLQHSPDVFPIVTGELSISKDLKLMLAAHTHGGQIRLPIIGRPGIPSSFGQKYAYGHIRENNVDLYVTSGIGTSVLPFRFLVPPEIVLLTLRAGN